MFRFTIRELLILTVTAGLAVGWWIDHRAVSIWQSRACGAARALKVTTGHETGWYDNGIVVVDEPEGTDTAITTVYSGIAR